MTTPTTPTGKRLLDKDGCCVVGEIEPHDILAIEAEARALGLHTLLTRMLLRGHYVYASTAESVATNALATPEGKALAGVVEAAERFRDSGERDADPADQIDAANDLDAAVDAYRKVQSDD